MHFSERTTDSSRPPKIRFPLIDGGSFSRYLSVMFCAYICLWNCLKSRNICRAALLKEAKNFLLNSKTIFNLFWIHRLKCSTVQKCKLYRCWPWDKSLKKEELREVIKWWWGKKMCLQSAKICNVFLEIQFVGFCVIFQGLLKNCGLQEMVSQLLLFYERSEKKQFDGLVSLGRKKEELLSSINHYSQLWFSFLWNRKRNHYLITQITKGTHRLDCKVIHFPSENWGQNYCRHSKAHLSWIYEENQKSESDGAKPKSLHYVSNFP